MLNAARSTSVGHVIVVDDGRVMHDRRIDIGVVDHSCVHAHHSGVVRKVSAAPFATGKTDAHISEAIVHAAVVANVRAPVTAIEAVRSAFKTPVGRRPEVSRLRSRHPCARNPVIPAVAISPVARRPQKSILWAERLFINHQRRRRNTYADKYSGIRRGRNDAEQ
jgi:hypothetical protein